MKKYLLFFRLGLAVELAYPVDFIGYVFTTLFVHLTRFLFLNGVFDLTSTLEGWTRRDVMVAFIFSVLLSSVVDSFTPSIRTFVRYAHTGRLEPYLVQPLDARWVMIARWIRPGSLFIFAIIAPIAMLTLSNLNVHPTLLQAVGGLFALVIGAIVNIAVMATWSLTTLVSKRDLPTEFIFRQVMRLNQLPPSLFGYKALTALVIFLPIVLTSTVPAMVVARGEYFLLAPMLGAAVLVMILFMISFRMTMRVFDGSGG